MPRTTTNQLVIISISVHPTDSPSRPKLVLLPVEQDEVQVEVVQLRSVRILAAATRLITATEVSMMTLCWAHYFDNASSDTKQCFLSRCQFMSWE